MAKTQEYEAIKEFSEAMKTTLYNPKREQCCVSECPGEIFRPGIKYCYYHWEIEIKQREKQRQKEVEENQKYRSTQQFHDDQRRNAYFVGHRFCELCGKFCTFDIGRARNRPGIEYVAGSFDNAFQTICRNCEKKKK